MLTNLRIRNFKRFDDVSIPLGNTVVFIGPNNSGKTTALQALALWNVGLRRWQEQYGGKAAPEKRPGVTINRRDLIAIPVPSANLLWHDLHTRNVVRDNGKQRAHSIQVDIVVEGVTGGIEWKCGLEFVYANEESFYCRPMRMDDSALSRMIVPEKAYETRIAYLPPMSGLSAVEPKWELGRINVLIGEGQTAQVLRNLCLILSEEQPFHWKRVLNHVEKLFGVSLEDPEYIAERGEITMSYKERRDVQLSLSSAGRGLQQTLLLLTYLYANPRSTLLLDEPDAHLEILRQRQIYQLLTDVASEVGSQIVAASHSEVILNEAADRDMVVAFVGRPHRIDDRASQSQVVKSLKEIGFEEFYQAEQKGWVLYLEGSTDLSILRSFAQILDHPAQESLDRPFVHYVGNQPLAARRHFFGLREAMPELLGVGIWDRDSSAPEDSHYLVEYRWQRREIENYLCLPSVLEMYAESSAIESVSGPLFAHSEIEKRVGIMNAAIADLVPPVALRDKSDPWWVNVKASDEFLDRVFERFYSALRLPNLMRKTDYHVLAQLVDKGEISGEIVTVLDTIVEVDNKSKPVRD